MTPEATSRARWAAVVLACVAQFMVILDVSVVNVALPAIKHALGFSATGLQWVVNAYTLTFAGFLLLGGTLTDLLSWQWILFINVPIGLGAALLAPRFVEEGRFPAATRQFDLAGALSVTLGLGAVVFAIVRTDVNGWGSAQTIVVLAVGLLLIAVFLAIEGRFATRPLMPLRIFRSRPLSGANAIVFLFSAAIFGMWFFVSLYLQQVLGYSPIEAGLAFLPMTLTIIVGSTVPSRLTSRLGPKPLLVAGMAFQTVGLLLFAAIS